MNDNIQSYTRLRKYSINRSRTLVVTQVLIEAKKYYYIAESAN